MVQVGRRKDCRFRKFTMPSPGMRLEQLDQYAQRHHGLITRAAASKLGVSRASWYHAVASGHLEQLYPNVARLWGSPPTLAQRALAAVWAVGPGALASHRTSASLWGIERPASDPIDVLMSNRKRYSRLAGIVVHRPRDVEDLRPILRHMVPTTNPMRMLLDLGAVDANAVESAMIAVMASKVASPAANTNCSCDSSSVTSNPVWPQSFPTFDTPPTDYTSEVSRITAP